MYPYVQHCNRERNLPITHSLNCFSICHYTNAGVSRIFQLNSFVRTEGTTVNLDDLALLICYSWIIQLLCSIKICCISFSSKDHSGEHNKWDSLYNLDHGSYWWWCVNSFKQLERCNVSSLYKFIKSFSLTISYIDVLLQI